jgi:lysophospholipase L1-like esterase
MKYLFHFLFLISVTSQAQYLNPAEPVRFLALGDSYTIGQSVLPALRWPRQLLDSLVLRGFTEETLKIIATTGWRTDNLLSAIAQEPTTQPYTLVSLLIGVNNQYQNRPISQYYAEFPQLLDSAIHLAGGNPDRVFVLSIPDYAFTPFGQNANPSQITSGINQYNEINRSITAQKGIAYFDITGISRQGVAEPSFVASDGLHPSGLQYTRWVSKILNTFDSLLVTTASESVIKDGILHPYPVPTSGWITIPSAEKLVEVELTGADGKSFRLHVEDDGRIWIGDRPKGVYNIQLGKRRVLLLNR